ncbi:biopolymer transport protein ExbD [Oxalobacteraceae bacterium GrIS 1.11]
MAFGTFNHHRQQPLMADINVTPMVDVMLVLLVIFIIAAPMFTQAVKLDLPRAQAGAASQQASAVTLSIDAGGTIFWNADAVKPAELEQRLAQAALQAPQPELQLRADKETRYEVVAQVMAAAQSKGLLKLSFITDPKKE